jgi:hypothetical protein
VQSYFALQPSPGTSEPATTRLGHVQASLLWPRRLQRTFTRRKLDNASHAAPTKPASQSTHRHSSGARLTSPCADRAASRACRDISLAKSPAKLALPPRLRLRIDCAGHALNLRAPAGAFTLGTATQATFERCVLSNYEPGEAANVSRNTDNGNFFEVPTSLFGSAPDASATVVNSFMEHPCSVRPPPPRCC